MTDVYLFSDEWEEIRVLQRRGPYAAGFGECREVPEELVARYENAITELREARNAVYDATNVKLTDYERKQPA